LLLQSSPKHVGAHGLELDAVPFVETPERRTSNALVRELPVEEHPASL